MFERLTTGFAVPDRPAPCWAKGAFLPNLGRTAEGTHRGVDGAILAYLRDRDAVAAQRFPPRSGDAIDAPGRRIRDGDVHSHDPGERRHAAFNLALDHREGCATDESRQ